MAQSDKDLPKVLSVSPGVKFLQKVKALGDQVVAAIEPFSGNII